MVGVAAAGVGLGGLRGRGAGIVAGTAGARWMITLEETRTGSGTSMRMTAAAVAVASRSVRSCGEEMRRPGETVALSLAALRNKSAAIP